MSFYVTLPSHANRREFPNNQANSFKIRLPQPLQLTGGGWQVGLSAISLPDTRVNLYELVMKGQHVLGIKWHLKAPSQSGGTYNKYGAAVTKIDDINPLLSKGSIARDTPQKPAILHSSLRYASTKNKPYAQ